MPSLTAPTCRITGCESPAAARELCMKHYQRMRRNGTTQRIIPAKRETCSVKGCAGRLYARDLCQEHWDRAQRQPKVSRKKLTALEARVKAERRYQQTTGLDWRPVPGYEGKYVVSEHGDVRALPRLDVRGYARQALTLKPFASGGYLSVVLSGDAGPRQFRVHALVAAAFLGPRPRGMDVNHVDHDRFNNCAANLEYVTRGENVRKAYDFYGSKRFGGWPQQSA